MKKVFVITILAAVVGAFYQCNTAGKKIEAAPVYAGTDKCLQCHQKEFSLYQNSDHFHAMDTVSASTVKANFNNSFFIYNGDTAFFYKKDNGYFVRTTDSTGNKKEFQISYTFGWFPLQQYLVKFNDGRIQVLPFCWDTRETEKGGQHWFHLYGKEKIAHTDELFWMGINQNWNYMCADCHTTDFKKNFNLSQNTFDSKWNESKVSCESCHGPASNHISWAATKDATVPYKGFLLSLASQKMEWKINANQTLAPVIVEKNDTLIEMCARCHARATRFTDEYVYGQDFLQSHLPATHDAVNYYIDGQIKQEDYEYASFLQSKMYANGVTCINCHEPHSMKVRQQGNALCTSCHQPTKYDGPQHSFHKAEGTGNQCVNCHMPVTTYMVVDNRLDHSIRIPRPDQSLTMGTPNACNKCHKDKSVQWAASSFQNWYGNKLPKEKNYAELMQSISRYINESEPSLYELLTNNKFPAITRATAMEQYGNITTARISTVLLNEIKSTSSLTRLNALKALRNYPVENYITQLQPLLNDKVRAVRFEAMSALAPFTAKLPAEESAQFNSIKSEYLALQEQMSHRPEGFFNRGTLAAATGDAVNAEQLYKECIQRFPDFIPSYTNLVDLYRAQEKEEDAKKIIDKGLVKSPGNGFLQYALALWYIRKKDNINGLALLQKAATNAPADPQVAYGYAIGLFSSGKQEEAIKHLEMFVNKYGNQPVVLEGLISMNQDMKRPALAEKYAGIRKAIFAY